MRRTDFASKFHVDLPVMQAPMWGAVSVEMVAAAAEAGALGCIPLGYGVDTEEEFDDVVGNVRMFTSKPFGVNLLVHDPEGDQGVTQLITAEKPALYSADRMPSIRRLMKPFRDALDVAEEDWEAEPETYETPRKTHWENHVAWAIKHKLTFMSFTYGLPPPWVVTKLHAEGVRTIGTACSVEEALAVQEAGMTAVVLSGLEAGGASPQFLAENPSQLGVFGLVAACEKYIKIPTIAAGGIGTPKAVKAALALGASGVVLGSALLLSYESVWKSKAYLLALLANPAQQLAPRPTIITRAYTGKATRILTTPIAEALVTADESIPHWPLHDTLMADIRAHFKDDPKHEYYPHSVGGCYMLAQKRSVRDIIYSIVEARTMDAVTDIMNEVLVSFENREPSGFDMPMMKFEHMMGANVAYVVGILLLKKIMSSDSIPAMDLKWFRAVYNLACVVLSAWSLYLAVVAAEAVGVFNGTWVCTQGTPEQMVVVHNCLYIFYVSKFFEYTDTVIMCLRKKFRQVSFLHVYHHASVSMVVWTYLAYKSGGDEYLAAGLNSFIHVLMYSHYFVTTFGMSTPWKQWLTKLQLLQFCCVFAQSAIAVKGRCGWPEWMKWQQLMYMTTMLVLFGNFFIQSYVVKKPKKKSE